MHRNQHKQETAGHDKEKMKSNAGNKNSQNRNRKISKDGRNFEAAEGEKAADKHASVYQNAGRLRILQEKLPAWYQKNCRKLPWRGTGNPYDVWLSEIMLQQTRVEAVKAYFLRFKEALPDISALAQCDEERLLKLWEGLGYYSRVRNLKKAAQLIRKDYDGALPNERTQLLKLPGIGSYTAGAIASIAYGKAEPAVDGNVLRVCARAAGNTEDISLPQTKRALEDAIRSLLLEKNKEPGFASVFNQALMELGAIVCVPNGKPDCENCPVREGCYARNADCVSLLPVKQAKKARRIEERTVFLLQDGSLFLIHKRPEKGLLAGLWELPNTKGKLTADEALKKVREMGLLPLRIEPLGEAKHIFTHLEWHMTGYRLRLAAEQEAKWNAGMYRFADSEALSNAFALPSAFEAYTKLARSV